MDKLSYTRMNNSDNVITIDLHNGYRVMAVSGYQPDTGKYITTLLLSDSTIDNWSLVEKAECLEFNCTVKTINSAILKQVGVYLEQGFFDYYIARYKFMVACVNHFYELYELEHQMGKAADRWKKRGRGQSATSA